MLSPVKERRVAALLAFAGVILPGLHKFYLRQPRWGIVYLLLCWTPIPKIASVAEGIWYLFQEREEFDRRFNAGLATSGSAAPLQPGEIVTLADAVRQLERLRQEGLVSEYEFEQKRRQLLDRMG
jgi:TM2 domain-containing membrane protein YozV